MIKLSFVYLRDGLIGNLILAALSALLAIILQGLLTELFSIADATTAVTVVIGILAFILVLMVSIGSVGELWGGTFFAKKRKKRERITSGQAILPILPLFATIPAYIYAYIVFVQNCSNFNQELKVALSVALISSIIYWAILLIVTIFTFWFGACPNCQCVGSYEKIGERRGEDFNRTESKTKNRSGRSAVGEIYDGSTKVGTVYQDWSSSETYTRSVKGYVKHITRQCIYCKRMKYSKEDIVTEKSDWKK